MESITRNTETSILTQDGYYFDLLNPESASHITVGCIAAALSKICRFGGHTKQFYSVAQHSVLVSQIVPYQYRLQALFHDATEAFIGDMVYPLKRIMPAYKAIEERLHNAIFDKLGIDPVMPPVVKEADRIALATERRDLMPADDAPWAILEGISPIVPTITALPPEKAQAGFMAWYRQIKETKYA